MIFYKEKVYQLISGKILVEQRNIKETSKSQLVEALGNLLIAKFRWNFNTILARERCTLNWNKPVAMFVNLMRRLNKEAVAMTVEVSYRVLTLRFWREGYFLEKIQ